MSLEEVIQKMVDDAVDARSASLPHTGSPRGVIDEETKKQIAQYEIIAHKTYLTKKEIALYIGCSDRSVEEWAARAQKDNPLPVGYAGSDMRAKRENLDKWIEREAQRKRLKLAS